MCRVLLTAALLASSAPALAGGFYLQEQSPTAVGRAFAGEAAAGDGAQTVYFNPAGMTRLGRTQIEVGGHALFVTARQQDQGSTRTVPGLAGAVPTGGGDGGNPFAQPILVPSGYGAFKVGDGRLWFGLGVSAPFGAVVEYDQGWFGRYDSVRSDLKTINIQPSVAFRVTDQLSVGAGFDIQKLDAELTSALPNLSPLLPDGSLRIKGQDLAFGWNAGVLWDAGPLRVGAHYRSRIKHDLTGVVQISGLLGPLAGQNAQLFANAPITTPDIASIGAVLDGGSTRLLAGASWYNWSLFNAITVNTNGRELLRSEQNYRDTWSASLGLEHDLTDRLTVRVGGMHDKTPTRDGFRTTRIPDGNRWWATGGATFRMNDAVALNLSYAHVFVGAEEIDRLDPLFAGTPAVTTVNTRSRNTGNADVLAASIALRF